MIRRSPRWTSVICSLAIALRSSLVAPSRWMVIDCSPCGLLTTTVLPGVPEPCGPLACATTNDCVIENPATECPPTLRDPFPYRRNSYGNGVPWSINRYHDPDVFFVSVKQTTGIKHLV